MSCNSLIIAKMSEFNLDSQHLMTFTPSMVVYDCGRKEKEENTNSLLSLLITLKEKLAMGQQNFLNDGVRTEARFGMKIFNFEDLGSNAILMPHNP